MYYGVHTIGRSRPLPKHKIGLRSRNLEIMYLINDQSPYRSVLDSYVAEQIPKLKTVQESDLESMFENFKPEDLISHSNVSANELIETFRLSLITESLTDQYADTYITGAKLADAEWLGEYITKFWVPDELGHADPFKNILLDFGFSQKSLDSDIKEAKETTEYLDAHESGLHPIALTTYGMLQECITDYWYELQGQFFPRTSNTSKVISKVKGREALHTVQFRHLTALQLEADPSLITEVIHAVNKFQMPSNHIPLVKEIEEKTQEMIPRMNGEVITLLRRIIRHLNVALNDKDMLGKLLAEYATSREQRFISLLPNHVVMEALNRITGGYGLIGEIVLDALGLTANEAEAETTRIERVQNFFRNIIRRWLRERLELEGFLASK